jgi:heme-degrading monooxygenase HmoA
VLVHWRIRPDAEADFLAHWKTKSVIEDRSGLIAEYLCEPNGLDPGAYTTWDIADEAATPFVSVGLWQSADAFRDQIAKYFNDQGDLLSFEKARRRRVVLHPAAWRNGQAQLPPADSPGMM